MDPAEAFGYMQRAFRQTMPYVIGSMRLLTETYSLTALNDRGFSLYADFRPNADAWGKRSEMRCSTILSLRKTRERKEEQETSKDEDALKKVKNEEQNGQTPAPKKMKVMSVEEYEALLDAESEDLVFDGDF